MFFQIYGLLVFISVISVITATPINGFISLDEIGKKIHRPHFGFRRNNYEGPQNELMQLMVAEEELEQTAKQLSNMRLYCPACNKEGYIVGGRHTMIEDGYYYLINHDENGPICIIIDQKDRDEILRQIRSQAYKKDITDPCLRYLATICKEAVENMGCKLQSTIKGDNFYSFKS